MKTFEYQEALRDLIQAQHNFDNAEPEFVDVAIHQLQAAEIKISILINEAKKPNLRNRLEAITGSLSDQDYRDALAIATQDIITNRVRQGKRTTLDEAIKIAAISVGALKRCG